MTKAPYLEKRRGLLACLFQANQGAHHPVAFLKHPTHQPFQVLRLRESQQNRVIGGLGELFDDLHVTAGVNAGPEEHFLEEVGAHQAGAGESEEDATRGEDLHGQEVDVFVAPAG